MLRQTSLECWGNMAQVTLEMCLMHDAYAWHAVYGAFGEDK